MQQQVLVKSALIARGAVPWPFSLVLAQLRIDDRSRHRKALGFKPPPIKMDGVAFDRLSPQLFSGRIDESLERRQSTLTCLSQFSIRLAGRDGNV